jgi:hypothetical protein
MDEPEKPTAPEPTRMQYNTISQNYTVQLTALISDPKQQRQLDQLIETINKTADFFRN